MDSLWFVAAISRRKPPLRQLLRSWGKPGQDCAACCRSGLPGGDEDGSERYFYLFSGKNIAVRVDEVCEEV